MDKLTEDVWIGVRDTVWRVVYLGRMLAKEYRKRAMVPLVRKEIGLYV